EMGGWVAHGAALYLLINTLPGDPTLWGSLFFSASSSVLGAGSGLPGGIGATEGLLGASLSIMKVPVEHMALAIGAFRLLTFWMWIPIGWLALVAIRRRSKREITNAEAT
ncbi:MAG: flippase-like domain-containing protein, partial [Halioglobus sp.]|nr:flippase-like domain-containing protein [Halioglobus sp.]